LAAAAGETVVRQGDAGDRFYLVRSGELSVDVDGVPAGRLGAGGFFGEIALLHDRLRTATVAATAPSELFALEREPFLAAVTGHPQSAEAAAAVAGARLGSVRTAGS
jgi:putative ABC transport system ATP-binding protein